MTETETDGKRDTPVNQMCQLIRTTYKASIEGGELLGRDVPGLKARAKQLAEMLASGEAKDRRKVLAGLVAIELLIEATADA